MSGTVSGGPVEMRVGAWLSFGWNAFKRDPGNLVLASLVAFLVVIGASIVPIIGPIASTALNGPIMLGLYMICRKQMTGEKFGVGEVFNGFNRFVPAFLLSLLVSIFVGIGFLLLVLPGLIVAGWYLFAMPFMMDKNLDFWEAMEASRQIGFKNHAGFAIFIFALAIINFIGAIPCGLGLLVTGPISMLAVLKAYGEIVGFSDGKTVLSLPE